MVILMRLLRFFIILLMGYSEENTHFDLVGTKALIESEFAQIKGLENIRQAGKVEDAVKATIDCRGEKLSIAMMNAWFEAKGYTVTVINPVEKLLAYGFYLKAVWILRNQLNELMQNLFLLKILF